MRRFDLGRKCVEYTYALGGEEPSIPLVATVDNVRVACAQTADMTSPSRKTRKRQKDWEYKHMNSAQNKARMMEWKCPFIKVDKSTTQWRCAACHNSQKSRLDTVKGTSQLVNTIPDTSGTDLPTLCSCCLHINTLKSMSIVDNVKDADKRQTSPKGQPDSDSYNHDLRNRINTKYPNLGALLSSTSQSNGTKATEQIPNPKDKPSGTCHISELLSAVGDEDDTQSNTFKEWFPNPTEHKYIDMDGLLTNLDYELVN